MAKLVALYRNPSDPAAFDAYYASTHAPLAGALPGLTRYEVGAGPVAVGKEESPYYLVAILHFESMDAIKAALASPEGQATAADLANFAQAGVDLLMFDTKDVSLA